MLGDVQVPTNYIKYPSRLFSFEGRQNPLPVMPRVPHLLTPRHLVARLKNKQ